MIAMLKRSFLAFAACLFAGCGANDNILRSGKSDPANTNVAATKTSFETDLESMRTAGFSFIYVLRRKDGGVIDAEDRSVIRVQTTQTNRRVSADDGKAVIIGSNFQIAAHNMAAIYQRFAVENYSPEPGQSPVPVPANIAAPEAERP